MYGYTERDYLSDFPYTDLAAERRRADISLSGVDFKRETRGSFAWERIKITSEEGAMSIGRPRGIYDTFSCERMDLLALSDIDDAADELARELCYLFEYSGVYPERLLVVGLGNPDLTPDAIGPMAAGRVRATMHIKEGDAMLFSSLECSEIAVITPGVTAKSGMDASVTVKALCNALSPDAVIAIDAIASRSPKRLGRTIQVSSTGITPGTGIGGTREPLSEATLGVPVIAIGVPTVIDSRMFWHDASGGEGDTSLAREAMFVSPKEINEIVEVAAGIIGGGINQAFGFSY